MVTVTPRTACSPLTLKQGQELLLTLPSDPSSGYRWLIDDSATSILKSLGPEVFSSADKDEDIVGAAGQSSWRFKSIHSGNAALALSYKQPWDSNAQPEKTFTCQIRVQ
nr:protease inhibitor I42 family protein [Pseudomonas duriflava]